MIPWWWSWLLTGVGAAGLLLAGRRSPRLQRTGWSVGLGAQLLWVAYAMHTHQPGFLASAGLYGTVYALNLATRPKTKEQPCCEHSKT